MDFNLILAVLFLGVLVGFLAGLKVGSKSGSADGDLMLDTTNDNEIKYRIFLSKRIDEILAKKQVKFNLKAK